jgi:FixJ family two-component response regulator
MKETEPTVFVVDDDPSVCDSLALLLQAVGRRAETFSSAAEFLEVYDAERAGCLVLDLRMQGMSGLDLQRRLEFLHSTLPIIFISAHGDSPMAVEAMKKGLKFVRKPFRDQDLLGVIERAIDENARRRESGTEDDAPTRTPSGASRRQGDGS